MKKQDTEIKDKGAEVPAPAAVTTVSLSRESLQDPLRRCSRGIDQLSDEQAVARIGQLLFEAYLLATAEAKAPTAKKLPDVVPIRTTRRDKHELAVRELLRGGGSWTPKALRRRIDCSRATISRVLKRLELSGVVISAGKTKGISYCSAGKEVRAA